MTSIPRGSRYRRASVRHPTLPSGVTALLDWLDEFRLGHVGPPLFQSVVNINVPSIRDGLDPRHRGGSGPRLQPNGRSPRPSNCLSSVTNFADDVDGFINGYVTISSIGN